MRYFSWKDRKKAAALMRLIYTAVNEAAAKAALHNLRREYGKKAPGLVAALDRAWDEFVRSQIRQVNKEGSVHD